MSKKTKIVLGIIICIILILIVSILLYLISKDNTITNNNDNNIISKNDTTNNNDNNIISKNDTTNNNDNTNSNNNTINSEDDLNDNNILFKFSYQNYAWAKIDRGYYIYYNGDIKEYDKYDSGIKLKATKISKEELSQLEELASIVEDKYEEGYSFMVDGGTSTKEIYNKKLAKWIVISQSGDSMGKNSTEAGKKISELTDQIYDKYLEED